MIIKSFLRVLMVCIVWIQIQPASSQDLADLKTIAEASGFTATSCHQDVLDFQDKLASSANFVRNREIGRTVNGRSMLATVFAKPDYQFGDQDDSRLVVLLLGNIHSGECAGKEGLMMLMRELAANPNHRWLKNLVIVFLPDYNADGNDRIGRNEIHRPGQIGPSAGMGLRENAQQLDLNRDFIKIESPEARALVKLVDDLNPHLFIDCHTTNGSRHRYHLTYDMPHNPSTPKSLRGFLRNQMMPAVTDKMESRGTSTFYYGNFSRDHTAWTTYGYEPRYSTEYVGLRGRLSILSEAYSYISYKDRILATKDFVSECIDYVDNHREKVRALLAGIAADAEKNSGSTELSLAAEVRPFDQKFKLKGYEGSTDTPKDYDVVFFGDYHSTRTKTLPYGYLLSGEEARVADRLLMHGIDVFSLTQPVALKVERFSISEATSAARTFQGHQMVSLKGSWKAQKENFNAGDYFIPTDQPLGRLAAHLLEPESSDGLTTWNFFDASIEVSPEHPVSVLPGKSELATRPVAQVLSRASLNLTKIYGALGEGEKGKVEFGGKTRSTLEWLNNRQYKTTWNGREIAVDAETGHLERLPVLSNRVATNRLTGIGIEMAMAEKIASGKRVDLGDAIVLIGENDLFWISKETDSAKRLTSDPSVEELVFASPDRKKIAFVKNNDLYRIELSSGKTTRLTNTGSENVLNGKLDWVYQEELYGRGNFKGFWWSPDSKSLAYLTLDQSDVKRYRVTDNIPVRQTHEVYPYPKAGDPNPRVAISVDGVTLDLKPFDLKEPLVSQVCWSPSNQVFFQLQNRIQNVMKLVSWNPLKTEAKILIEESVAKGWLDSPGNPVWNNNDESQFVWFTHRGGRRQIATFNADGSILEPGQGMTQKASDPLEVRSLEGVSGDAVYFTAAIASDVTKVQLYRLDQTGVPKLVTNPDFDHSVTLNAANTYFFDRESSPLVPTRIALRRSDGTFVRYILPNLVDHLDYYDIVAPQFHRVPTADGDEMDGMIIYPPDFDDSKKYPVLMHVYSGPQAPRVRKRWGGTSYLWHQMMAQKGFIIWMCDNRSASYRGLDKSFPIYGDLGRKELADFEQSLQWLKKQPGVDPDRIGIWGWSYGGYMTSYAMTHSKSFKVGIAGAPVTDWRNYDSIYTERYMGLPSTNQSGYDDSSVVKAASQLHGKLLIIHGTQDDNVHISNTFQLINALQKAGKQFDLMIYPKNRHAIRAPNQMRHLRQLMTDFFVNNL